MKFIVQKHRGEPLTDSNGTEATAEYYIVRIYRRCPGKDGEPASLVGVVEDIEGGRQAFRDSAELWDALMEESSDEME
jgi:hypothetical protein